MEANEQRQNDALRRKYILLASFLLVMALPRPVVKAQWPRWLLVVAKLLNYSPPTGCAVLLGWVVQTEHRVSQGLSQLKHARTQKQLTG